MKDKIRTILADSARLKTQISGNEEIINGIAAAASACKERLAGGGTIYACGNGGSTCDAMHFVEELVARFKRERKGFRAMHFMDSAVLTCWSNDYDFGGAFERQAETFCGPRDVLFGFSTSGNSDNILRAVRAAKLKGAYTIGFTGKDGGALKSAADLSLIVPDAATERIQEVHIMFVHILCELLENG